jgi:hypothetical protein
MSREALGTYLNDHLSGSVGAAEMMERVSKEQQGTPLGELLGTLATEIRGEQDREQHAKVEAQRVEAALEAL